MIERVTGISNSIDDHNSSSLIADIEFVTLRPRNDIRVYARLKPVLLLIKLNTDEGGVTNSS